MSYYDHNLLDMSSAFDEAVELDIDFVLKLQESGLSLMELNDLDLDSIDETVADMIPGSQGVKTVANHLDDIKDLRNQWDKVADKFVMHKWINRFIKDEKEEAELHKYYDIICEEGNTDSGAKYTQYKKAFKYFCDYFGLPVDATIIEWFTFDYDKEDKQQKKLSIRYSRGIAKIRVPDDMILYHSSPAKGITQLIPSYKSKTKGKFLYPDKRVFFTVQKNINPFKFGMGKHKYLPIKDKDTKLYKYTPAKPIGTVYIDPTYSLRGEQGLRSVYVKTESPINVKDITNAKKNIVGKEEVKESVMITESGILTDPMLEALFAKKEEDEVTKLLKDWSTSNQNHKPQVFKNDNLSEEDYDKLGDIYDILRHTDDYHEYKKAFDQLCKFCHIVPRGTIITKCKIKSGRKEGTNSILVEYTANTRKMRLPDGIKLYHMSKVAGIEALNPVFRGKSVTGYMYDKPRVYFTIHKDMPKFLADYSVTDKVHKYECKLDIKDVYVDPLVWNGKLQGAVYVESDKPIPVEEMGIPKKPDNADNKEEKK